MRLLLSFFLAVSIAVAEMPLPEYCGRLAESAGAQQAALSGIDGWLFLTAELRYLRDAGMVMPAAEKLPEPFAAPLAAILDFHAQLQKIGVKLLLVPVPPKCLIFPDKLPRLQGEAPAMSGLTDLPVQAAFYAKLREAGVIVLDLSQRFYDRRDDERGAPYCRQDSHWSGNGCVWAAAAIAEIVRPDLPPAVDELVVAWREITINGDLTAMLAQNQAASEKLLVRQVSRRGEDQTPIALDENSPVILMGDSHNLVFHAGADMHATGAGLADQLALELGWPVELVAVRGAAATPARVNLYRRAARRSDYWHGRRWVVWCFAAREFLENRDWQKVPIVLPAPTRQE